MAFEEIMSLAEANKAQTEVQQQLQYETATTLQRVENDLSLMGQTNYDQNIAKFSKLVARSLDPNLHESVQEHLLSIHKQNELEMEKCRETLSKMELTLGNQIIEI